MLFYDLDKNITQKLLQLIEQFPKNIKRLIVYNIALWIGTNFGFGCYSVELSN
jgi:hypothetical protein